MQNLPTKPSISAQERTDRQLQLTLTLLAVASVALSMLAAGLSWGWFAVMPVSIGLSLFSKESFDYAILLLFVCSFPMWLGISLLITSYRHFRLLISRREWIPEWHSHNPSRALIAGFTCVVLCYSLIYGLLLSPAIFYARTTRLYAPSALEVHIYFIVLASLILSPIVFLVSRWLTRGWLDKKFPLFASAAVRAATGLAFIGLSISPSPVFAIPIWLYQLVERWIAIS
jgi:hypothetical protein